jgi:antitoxin VapB
MEEKSINIKNPEAARLARRLAALEGRSITESLTEALRDRLARLEKPAADGAARAAVRRIQELVRGLPDLDEGGEDAVLGYDEHGLPS